MQAVRNADVESASIASAIAQVPVPPSSASALRSPAANGRSRVHDRAVIDAVIQSRVGLARRRGDKVGVILVRIDDDASCSASGAQGDDSAALLQATANAILDGIRDADVIGRVDTATLALLPAEDGGRDVNAFVGRLRRHLERSQARLPELAGIGTLHIDTVWLDPGSGRSGRELLDEALQPA